MSAAQEKARDAIYEAIVQRTKSVGRASEPDADLVKLADAYSKVTHGPQGGTLDRLSDERNDYHYTQHPSDEPRRAAGFDTTPRGTPSG